MKRLLQRFYDLKLRHKMLVMYLLVVLIPLSVTAAFSYAQLSRALEDEQERVIDQSFDSMLYQIERRILDVSEGMNLLAADPNVQDGLSADYSRAGVAEQIELAKALESAAERMMYQKNLFKVRIYASQDALFANQQVILYGLHYLSDLPFYNEAVGQDGNLYWSSRYTCDYIFDNSEEVVSAFRAVKNIEALDQIIGYLCIDIRIQELETILRRTGIEEYNYLVDREGRVVAGPAGEPAWDEAGFCQILQAEGRRLTYEGYRVTKEMIGGTGWTLLNCVPAQASASDMRKILG